MRVGWWGLIVGTLGAGCIEPTVLDPSEAARAGARSVMWVWSDPKPAYWLQDLDEAERFPFQRPDGASGVRAMFYRCPASQLNLELGLQPWTSGCVPPTQRRFREDGGRLVPDPTLGVPDCSPCLLWPLRVTANLTLPRGFWGSSGVFVDDDTAVISTFNDATGTSNLFRVEFDPPSVAPLSPGSGPDRRPLGPMLLDGQGVFAVRGDEDLEVLTVGRDDIVSEKLPPTSTGTKAAHSPSGRLLADGDRLLWSSGFGSLWAFDRSGVSGWRQLERDWDFSTDADYAIRTSMERLSASTIVGVGVTADRAHYVTRPVKGVEVPYLRRYFLLRGEQLDPRPLPDAEEPVSVVRTQARPYLIDQRGAAYPVGDDGSLGQRREVTNGSDLRFAVGGVDRLFYAGTEGTFWAVFPEAREVCPAVSVAFGGVMITQGRYLLHVSGEQVTFGEFAPIPDCDLEAVSAEEP